MFTRITTIIALLSVLAAGFVVTMVALSSDYIVLRRDNFDELVNYADSLERKLELTKLELSVLKRKVQKLELLAEMRTQKGRYLVVDRAKGKFWIRDGKFVIYEGVCGVGKGVKWIRNKKFNFETPAGIYHVKRKLLNPWWIRPNWFWYERGLEVPKKWIRFPKNITFERAVAFYNSLSKEDKLRVRAIPGYLGKYVLDLGGGIFIHYSKHNRGAVSHGCIRVSEEDSEIIWKLLEVGDPVYIF